MDKIQKRLKRYLVSGDNVKYLSLKIRHALSTNSYQSLKWLLEKAETEFPPTNYYKKLLCKGFISLADFYRKDSKFELELFALWKSRKYSSQRKKIFAKITESISLQIGLLPNFTIKRDFQLLNYCVEIVRIIFKQVFPRELKENLKKKIKSAKGGIESPLTGQIESLLLNMYDDLDDDEVADKFAEILKDDIIISIMKDRKEKKDEEEK